MSQIDFSKLFEAPIQKQLEPLKENSGSSRRESIDAIEPEILYRKLAEGARSAKSAYASHLSNETYSLIDACLAKAKQDCEQVKTLWNQLDYYDRNGVWEGLKAGYSSGETQVGAVVGKLLFGELGAVIGGALGGWVAGSRVDENFQKGMQEYCQWFISWCEELDSELQNRILPSVQRDLERPLPPASVTRQLLAAIQSRANGSGSIGRVFAGLLLLAGFSTAGWYYYQHREAQRQATTALPTAEQNASLAALQGKWLSDNTRVYDAVLVGDTLEFRIHSVLDSKRDGYQSGEMHFRLRRTDMTDTVFAVEQKARPILPSSLKYSKESQDSCQELMANLDGQTLKAQLVGDRLSVDMVKLPAAPEILDAKRGQVLSCKNLQQAKISKIQIALNRLPPGKDFPPVDKLMQTRKTASKIVSTRTMAPALAPTDGEHTSTSRGQDTDSLEKPAQAQGIGSAE